MRRAASSSACAVGSRPTSAARHGCESGARAGVRLPPAFRATTSRSSCRGAAGRAAIRRGSRRYRRSRLERRAPQPEALSNSIVSRSSAMRRVDSGQRRSGPVQAFQMLLIGKSRHRVVGLRLEARPHNSPFRGGGEHRQPRAGDEIVDKRGEKDRLAGARKAGHAEAQARRRKNSRRSTGRRAPPRRRDR